MNRFDQLTLKLMAEQGAAKLVEAKDGVEYFSEPYKHIVIDNFLPNELAELCLEKFPNVNDETWERTLDQDIEVKMRTTWKSEFDIPDGIVDAIRILNSSLFLRAMSERIGINKIIPDPYFSGGGLNAMLANGLLDVHVDGNYHDATGLNRRLNAILYLNKNWKSEWGGGFGVYDNEGKNCIKVVDPIFNRLVIFDSHDYSYHGLPDPMKCPEDEVRKSIILYYYTKEERPAHQVAVKDPHSALWVKRDFLDKRGEKARKFT